MKNIIVLLSSFVVVLCISCTEDYVDFPGICSKTLVVNGCITNEKGLYRIRLTEDMVENNMVISSPVNNARLTITDHLGNIDELRPLWEEEIVTVFDDENDMRGSNYFLLPNRDGGYDSIKVEFFKNFYDGTYYTTSTVGTPGGTYTLNIKYNDKSYSASDKMPFPSMLDSIVLRNDGKSLSGKEEKTFEVPYLYFKKPENESYFLFTYKQYQWSPHWGDPFRTPKKIDDIFLESSQKSWASWDYAVLSDRLMSSYVSGYKISGASLFPAASGTDEGWYDGFGAWQYADFYMVSVSRQACLYYQALIEQFYQDGGVFSSAPASPPTNLNNGAQGFFMAVAVEQKRLFHLD